eukprot:gene1069-10588_t
MQKFIEHLKANKKDKKITNFKTSSYEKKSKSNLKTHRERDNSFENIKQKRNFEVLGKRDQTVSLSRSRSRQIEDRKNTLMKEFHNSKKENQFIDRRNEQIQRQMTKVGRNRNRYNIDEGSNLQNERSLSHGKDRSFNDDERRGEKRKRNSEDVFNEIIKKSKFHKNQKKRELNENELMTEDINDDFDSISSFLTFNKKEKEKITKNLDSFDEIIKSLQNDKKYDIKKEFQKKQENEDEIELTNKMKSSNYTKLFDDIFKTKKFEKILTLNFKNQHEFESLFLNLIEYFFKINESNEKENVKVLNLFYEKLFDIISINDSENSNYFIKDEMFKKFKEIFDRTNGPIENKNQIKLDLYFINLILNIFNIQNEKNLKNLILIYLHKMLLKLTTKLYSSNEENKNEDYLTLEIFVSSIIFKILKDEESYFSTEIIFWIENSLINFDLKKEKEKNISFFELKNSSKLLNQIFEILLNFIKLYSNLINFNEIFEKIESLLKNEKKFSTLKNDLKEKRDLILKEIENNSNEINSKRKPIQYLLKKPIELDTFEPLIFSDFGGEIVDKRKNKNFERKIKREKRSTIRELRKDNLVLRKAREEDQNRIDNEKKKKFNKIIKEIESEKHQQSKKDFSMRKERKEIKDMRKNRKGK